MAGLAPRRTFTSGLVYLALFLAGMSTLLAFVWVFLISLKTTPEFLTSSPWSLPAELFAGILMASVPALILFALLQDHITREITQGALKG